MPTNLYGPHDNFDLETIQPVVGFKGDLAFDASKPDGTPGKLLDRSRLRYAQAGNSG